MYTLQEIGNRMLAAPTVMPVELELKFAQELMSIPIAVAAAGGDLWQPIIRRLYESHIDTFYSVTPENFPEFLRFADWLDEITKQPVAKSNFLDMTHFADHFRVKPF
ncbi:hypothetical protein E4L96_06800 [Massilia arenosa]|uniref:Uncharacterized protein n=1 Tax=Zemynaea arenosa TaxID=2561931 RepID=A0A4Y9SGM9_9BURK|nr:hypothetical protein [Massilia arenosa]TFW23394.1 hypothetical protein E4L96_06800 [Massilia arenosa]